MPSSRKKKKGQARKAKMIEDEAALREEERAKTCLHGCPPMDAAQGQQCVDFVGAYRNANFPTQQCSASTGVDKAVCATFNSHPHVWNDDNARETIKRFIVGSVTKRLQSDHGVSDNMIWRHQIDSYCVMNLEGSIRSEANGVIRGDSESLRELRNVASGCERSLLRFYRKRIPCTCLDDMSSEAKKLPKMGVCNYCRESKEYKSLMDCSLCKQSHYCSRTCQELHWMEHKSLCKRSGLRQTAKSSK